MPDLAIDWSPGGARHRRLAERAAICACCSLAPGLLMIALGLLASSWFKAVFLGGALVVLAAAILLLIAEWTRLPARAIVAVTWAAIAALAVTGAPMLLARFLACAAIFHVLALVMAVRVLTEHRSFW
ncbi:hypothetical protein Afil01_22620 [Actinorhabdospora filicis]|uniref:MerC domain-containing protein n=1 Tax=Actinorhabdospora filicis TaxID=1785913 RepID=A0A9W6SHY8_9ACTN|nr:hypothetical protein [Actinorhabdospora filicis]GLZ77455.1 hypothetical protein Afil01_22620 [Actinorhabdospora filicis]